MSTPTQGPAPDYLSDDAKEVQRVIYKALADARMDHDGAKAVMIWRRLDAAGRLAASAPQGDTADVIERAAKIAHDRQCGCPDYQEHADEDTGYVEMMGAVSAAGLLAVSPAAPQAAGYIIAGPDKDGRMECDWDGKVHESRADGDAELALCRETYDDWGLYAMYPVGSSAPVPAAPQEGQQA